MSAPERYAIGDFVLERSQERVLDADGTPLNLTPRLFSALLVFAEHAGELLDKDTLMRALWPGLVVEENNLSQVISGLRRALGDDAQGSRYIQTVPRRGFRLVAAVSPLPPASPLIARSVELAVPARGRVDRDAEREPDGSPLASRRRWLWAVSGGVTVGLIGAGWLAWRTHSRTDAAVEGVTLAVLPFKPLVAEGRDELLEVGMAESLIAHLSTMQGLVVRSIGSVRRYAGAEQDPLRAARELDVDWIIDGSLQRRGDELRATARLLRATDGSAAWSGSFDERLAGVFVMQDQISNRVAHALAPMLRAEAGTPVVALVDEGGTRSTEAYQLYLAASRLAQGGRADRIDRAIGLFNQALGIDPAYARAWVGLAWAYRHKLWNVDALPTEVFDPANVALNRAIVAAPRLAEAHAGLGFSLYWFDFDWSGAENKFRSVLKVNPNIALAHYGLGLLLSTQDRIEEGFVHMRTARELDPMAPVFNTVEASLLLDRGRVAEARTRLSRSLDIAPDLWLSHVALGALRMVEQQPEQGIDALRKAVALAHGSVRPRVMLAVALAGLGRRDEARAILNELVALAKVRYVPPTSLAAVHAALGEGPQALDALELGLLTRDTRLIYLKDDPHWIDLRKEPRFVALMRKLKLDRFGQGLSPV